MSSSAPRKALARTICRSGGGGHAIMDVRSHDPRHTCASEAVMGGESYR